MAVGRDLLLLVVGVLAGAAIVNTYVAGKGLSTHGAPASRAPARRFAADDGRLPDAVFSTAPSGTAHETQSPTEIDAEPQTPSPAASDASDAPTRSATRFEEKCNRGKDDSYAGLKPSLEGVIHAFTSDDTPCLGAGPVAGCVANITWEYLRKHVRLGVVTGRRGVFRVEVSQCTWLSHFPPETVSVFSDVVPAKPRTPHQWVALGLPPGVTERHCDLYSQHITKGYHRTVKSNGQGYSVSWIKAQFRFLQGLQHLGDIMFAADGSGADVKWALLIDDDTIVSPDRLVKRLKALDIAKPWYLSRRGWGGAGHFYSREAMRRVHANASQCVDRWMVRQFRASDTTLLKCGHHLRLNVQMEESMSHCPASTLRQRLLDPRLASMHGKKDFYPPPLLAVWRTALYYLAAVCDSPFAKDAAVEYSACTYGASCKTPGCDKEKDKRTAAKWAALSQNNTIKVLPLAPHYDVVRRRLREDTRHADANV